MLIYLFSLFFCSYHIASCLFGIALLLIVLSTTYDTVCTVFNRKLFHGYKKESQKRVFLQLFIYKTFVILF